MHVHPELRGFGALEQLPFCVRLIVQSGSAEPWRSAVPAYLLLKSC